MILHLFDFVCAAAWIEYRRDTVALKKKSKEKMDYLKFKISVSEWLLHYQKPTQSDDESDEVSRPIKKRKIQTPHPNQGKRKNGATYMPEIANDDKKSPLQNAGL